MSCKVLDVADECVNHEVCVFGRNVLHYDLYDMVTILITDTVENVILELINHGGLLVNKNMLQSLENSQHWFTVSLGRTHSLHYSAAIYLARQLVDFSRHDVEQCRLLTLITTLDNFLNHIVPVNIFHQLDRIWHELPKHSFLLVACGCLKLVLDELRAMLISTELDNVIVDVLIEMSVQDMQ